MTTEKLVITMIGAFVLGLFVSFLLSWPIMVLWNDCLVPAIQGVNEISWLQAWGLSVLSTLMFNTKVSSKV